MSKHTVVHIYESGRGNSCFVGSMFWIMTLLVTHAYSCIMCKGWLYSCVHQDLIITVKAMALNSILALNYCWFVLYNNFCFSFCFCSFVVVLFLHVSLSCLFVFRLKFSN